LNISIIIPTLNEADRIAALIDDARLLGSCEIIVVDGHSDDGTLQRASGADRCLTAPRGRARQMNAGAAAARGDVLLFLHADCRLAPGSLDAARTLLDDPRTAAGCFRQHIDAPGRGYRCLEWGNNLRVRLFGRAYGDQGIFVRRSIFDQLGGFPDVPFLEDAIFSKAIRRLGRLRLADGIIHVSARRWERAGIIRQTLRNWTILLLARLGVSPARLARLYRPVR